MKSWDCYELHYIFDHGGYFDSFGIVHFPHSMKERASDSIRHPNCKMISIPSIHGLCLIFETIHFVFDN